MTVLAHDAGGRELHAGTTVRICDDVASLYEQGRSEEWIVERAMEDGDVEWSIPEKAPDVARRRMMGSRILRLVNKDTGIWVRAPALWVTIAHPAAKVIRDPDPLVSLAHALMSAAPDAVTNWAQRILSTPREALDRALERKGFPPGSGGPERAPFDRPAWARPGLSSDDVKTAIIQAVGCMADARTPEMQAAYDAAMARESGLSPPASSWHAFLTRLMQQLNNANIGALNTPDSIREGITVLIEHRDVLSAQVSGHKQTIANLQTNYDELKARLEQIQKALG